MDKEGYLITKPDSTIKQNIPGVFEETKETGDVKDKIFRQAVNIYFCCWNGMYGCVDLEAEKHL